MRTALLIGSLVGLLAGCSADLPDTASLGSEFRRAGGDSSPQLPLMRRSGSGIATLPDRGSLVAYGSAQPVRKGPYTLHPVQLSEQHALRAIGEGAMVVHAPNGEPIRLKYERHVAHPDGNWTWVGRPDGAKAGVEAILTFGERAVFGSIPNGMGLPLQLTTAAGRSWIVETDRALLGQEPRPSASASDDFLVPALPQAEPQLSASMAATTTATTTTTPAAIPTTAAAAPPDTSPVKASAKAQAMTPLAATTSADTVDLLIGYTSGFAARLGGQSQAVTRLNFLVDVTNQAYENSQVAGRVRLVHAMQVNYPDATSNRSALFQLTGVNCVPSAGGQLPDGGVSCTTVGQPAALQPLIAARELYRADLVSLVRNFESPENQSCGLAWMLGGGQTSIDYNSANFGMSVVSDSNGTLFPDDGITCRHEMLAHELGHSMGLQHDRATAADGDDSNGDTNLLDPEEFGRYPYSFGYRLAGNFYTVMTPRVANEDGFRVFSNPRITFCGGLPCGVADQADNARALAQTMPGIASFRAAAADNVWFRGDFDGDGRSDILWRNPVSGQNVIWRSANSSTTQAVTPVSGQTWKLMGAADFDGDGRSDLLWRNAANGANVIWKSANSATPQAMTTVAGTAWTIVGAGDFDGDGKADVLWRNVATGANGIWKSANSATQQPVSAVPDLAWTVVGIGDFNGDGRSDILWRNVNTGANGIWRSGSSATVQAVTAIPNTSWRVAAVGDFDGDNRADILWRNAFTGGNALWKSGNSATPQVLATVGSPQWQVVGAGDFDGDNRADVLWRNFVSGANGIWKSANPATPQAVTTVHLNWFVSG